MGKLHLISDGDLEVRYNTSSTVKLGVNCLLIQKNNKNILIDTGTGNFNPDENKYQIEYPRRILTELKTINLKPTDIDIVVLTHFHFDHCGGCFNEKGYPVFINAEHYMQTWEIQNAEKDHNLAKYMFKFSGVLGKHDLFRPIDGNIVIEDSIDLIRSKGHTAGFQYVKFTTNENTYVFPGDIIPTLWHLNNNNFIGLDYDPTALNTAKNEIIEECIYNNITIIFQHSLKPTMGKLVRKEKRVGFKRIENNT
ncbi:MAG: MBL fold metallo-hydrolase [Candidatus Delongbacteria bacterium]|nr:MBL fold metallo-hydrolase [Candidatus Delongbacteria bacterium]